MVDAVVPMVNALYSYAADEKDMELMEKTNITATDSHKVRDAERGLYATMLLDMVESKKAELADRNVTDANFTHARQMVAAFIDSLGSRNSSMSERSGGRDVLFANFSRADEMLENYRPVRQCMDTPTPGVIDACRGCCVPSIKDRKV
jgi:hypothetical protein